MFVQPVQESLKALFRILELVRFLHPTPGLGAHRRHKAVRGNVDADKILCHGALLSVRIRPAKLWSELSPLLACGRLEYDVVLSTQRPGLLRNVGLARRSAARLDRPLFGRYLLKSNGGAEGLAERDPSDVRVAPPERSGVGAISHFPFTLFLRPFLRQFTYLLSSFFHGL